MFGVMMFMVGVLLVGYISYSGMVLFDVVSSVCVCSVLFMNLICVVGVCFFIV